MIDKASHTLFMHTPVMSAQGDLVFPHDPVPHARNKLHEVKGLFVEGRWTTKAGQRVMSLLFTLLF
jgi:hypothetical protein